MMAPRPESRWPRRVARALWVVSLKLASVLLIVAGLGLQGGCGFERVMPQAMPARLRTLSVVTSDHYTDFSRALQANLKQKGVTVYAEPQPEVAVLEVLSDASGQKVLSVSATNTPTEYEVFYTVKFRVRVGTQELLAPTEFTLRREYSYSVTAALAKQHEQETIRQAMASEIARLVMRRVASLNWS